MNFIPLHKNIDDILYSQARIVIIIRKISENELKTKKNTSSKSKILGSFCHELRTSLNSLINMIDIIQMTCQDLNINIINDYLSNAAICSHLFLCEIDDFVDYFSLIN